MQTADLCGCITFSWQFMFPQKRCSEGKAAGVQAYFVFVVNFQVTIFQFVKYIDEALEAFIRDIDRWIWVTFVKIQSILGIYGDTKLSEFGCFLVILPISFHGYGILFKIFQGTWDTRNLLFMMASLWPSILGEICLATPNLI